MRGRARISTEVCLLDFKPLLHLPASRYPLQVAALPQSHTNINSLATVWSRPLILPVCVSPRSHLPLSSSQTDWLCMAMLPFPPGSITSSPIQRPCHWCVFYLPETLPTTKMAQTNPMPGSVGPWKVSPAPAHGKLRDSNGAGGEMLPQIRLCFSMGQ